MSLISPILGGLGTAFGAYMGARADKKNRQWQTTQNQADTQFAWDMYDRQRRDAQSDWESQNAYNHPLEQMNRLRQAGLNPHLVYGKGADNTAAMVRSSQGGSQHQTAPRMDASWSMGLLGQFLSLEQTRAQTDNLYAQRQLSLKQGAYTDSQTARSKFDLDLQGDMRDSIVMKSRLENEKLSADIAFTLDSNDRAKISNAVNVEKTIVEILGEKLHQKEVELRMSKVPLEKQKLEAEIAQLKQITANADLENQLKQIDLQIWHDFGLRPHDPMYARVLMQFLTNLANAGKQTGVESGKDYKNQTPGWISAMKDHLFGPGR